MPFQTDSSTAQSAHELRLDRIETCATDIACRTQPQPMVSQYVRDLAAAGDDCDFFARMGEIAAARMEVAR